MKKLKFLTSIFLVSLMMGCSSDDSSPQPQNNPPEAFTLLEVLNNDTEVELLPTFTWNISTDPDGDAVSYDLYLGLDPNLEDKVISSIAASTFTAKIKLNWAQQYFWKVVAKDGKGGETQSEIFSFTTRTAKVTKIEPVIPFTTRSSFASVVYNNKIWAISGAFGINKRDDVWSSDDGITWAQQELPVSATPPFNGRRRHTSVVFNDKMWTIAGSDNFGNSEKEVWSGGETVDNWEFMGNAQFSGREAHTSVVFGNKLWVIGGVDSNNYLNDTWSSEDGITWEEVTPTGNIFSERSNHASVVFDNKIWVIGGAKGVNNRKNDVWNSEDGIAWNEVLANAPFSARDSHKLIDFDNKLWIIGGIDSSPTNDIWYSEDGNNWIDATPQNSFIPTNGHEAIVFENKIWILGGIDINGDSNIWTIE